MNRVPMILSAFFFNPQAQRVSSSGTAPLMAGTAREVADQLEAWFTAGAADGFNLMFPLLPEDWTNFASLVVPELQRRGLARKEYGAGTLRERLGLSRPANRFAANRASASAAPRKEEADQPGKEEADQPVPTLP